jgi:hypothetical protein
MNAQEKLKDVANNITNVAQNVANKAQNLVNATNNKVKTAGKQSAAKLQYVSQDAKNMATAVGNNIKILTYIVCSPALVYLAIGATTLSSSFINGMDTSMFGVRLIKLLLWTYCVNYLCRSGYTSISWGIVMIPYALIPLQMLGITKFPQQYIYALLSQDEQDFFGI